MLSPHMHNLGYLLYLAQRTAFYGLAQALRQSCVEHGKSYVITPQQWGVLGTLAVNDGLPAGKLSQALASDAPTTTGVISRLEHSGLVCRRHDDTDRRVVKVFLTDEGRAAMAFLPAVTQTHLRNLTVGFSEDEQRQLIASLEHLMTNALRVLPNATEYALPWFVAQRQEAATVNADTDGNPGKAGKTRKTGTARKAVHTLASKGGH